MTTTDPVTPVEVTPRFKRLLKKKDAPMVAAIAECIVRLRTDRTHPGLHTHKVQGTKGVFEAYIDDANRLTFHWDGSCIVLRANCNHDILKSP